MNIFIETDSGGGGGGPHRYWRMRAFTLPGGSFLEITEAQFHDSGGRVIGTLSSSDVPAFGSVANLNDNDTTSGSRAFWSTATAEAPGFYIAIDASTPVEVTGVAFAPDNNATRFPGTGVEVQYSDDNSSWTSAGTTGTISYPGNNTLSAVVPFS